MDSLSTFIHDKVKYVLLEDIKTKEINKTFFIGCKSVRKCVEKHNIPDDKVLYMKNDKIYTKNYKSADVFVEEQYAKDNIMNKDAFKKKKEKEENDKKKTKEEVISKERNTRKEYNEKDIMEAPAVVYLEEHEMFKDDNGDSLDIEMRGKKNEDKAYFKAIDIGKAFDIKDINHRILHTQSDHVYDTHYTFFILKDSVKYRAEQKVLYLTYLGVLKVLFCARGNNAQKFNKWATRILFTMQMGSQEDKDSLAAEALNVDVSTVKLFRKSCRAVPCVYLFEVGTVGNMRQHFNLKNFKDDNDKVYKFGRTEDMARRSGEHQNTYGKLKDNSFSLAVFSYIDELYASKAETKLKQFFNNMNVNVEDAKHNELIVMNKSKFKTMKDLYNNMYIEFSGNNKDLIKQMQEMQLNHQQSLKDKDHEQLLKDKDHQNRLQQMIYEQSLKDKDKDHIIEIMTMKHKTELQEVELQYMRQLLANK
uniref:Bro-N domain-containing protein n=1 Tax=Pyramimonas orientalis virus TaxID=455367 RepID=A0A7M3UP68_POV01|nr:hypothetical protein HWQ62_00404 [Pyramimonas orientalis virus]